MILNIYPIDNNKRLLYNTIMDNKIHLFEQSGLGKAPFAFVEWFEGNATPPAPITVCDYCSNVIKNCFKIQSSDGKTFVVGSECVKKTGDKGLHKVVEKEARRQKTIKDWQKWLEVKNAIKESTLTKDLQEKLSALPHPYKTEMTMFDYAHYIAWNGGYDSSVKRIMRVLK